MRCKLLKALIIIQFLFAQAVTDLTEIVVVILNKDTFCIVLLYPVDIAEFPNALAQFENEITLPLHTLLSDEDIDYVLDAFARSMHDMEAEGRE